MLRTALAVVAATALALVLVTTALSRTRAVPTLTGTVGPGYTITLKLNNKVVKTLKAGSYTFYCTLPGHRQAGMVATLIVQ